MSSSPKSRLPDPVAGLVLVREGGVEYRPAPSPDPFVAWVELMEVIEALCPRWPPRAPTIESGRFVL